MQYGPDPNSIYPNEKIKSVCYIKNVITRPNIIVGDYTYYDDINGPVRFEERVTHHYEFLGDKLIIGKFCAIAKGIEFIMNGANHRMCSVTTYPFSIMGHGWEKATPTLGDLPFKGDTVVGNDVWIGQNVTWHIQYNRNNQTYRMLISICWLLVKGLLQTNSDGSTKLMDFLDEQRMCRLYEKFILEYYKREFPLLNASASQIPWALDDGISDTLPVMQSDIMLTYENRVLIIDAKYYTHTTQVQYDTHSLHSSNLYQIFTYVKNKEAELADQPHEVSGMILYARTDEAIQPDNEYRMSGNRISVRTFDLNRDFSDIAKQLNTFAKEYFGESALKRNLG